MTMDFENIKNIKDCITFDEIAQCRELAHKTNEKNGFNLKSVLTGGYKDPAHFIYELLQNAEDVYAKIVTFKLYPDKLIFSHNGTRQFDLNDIRSITGIADSAKAENPNTSKDPTIGRFGMGFKSVFKICESPKIYSDTYCFEINNLYVPRSIEKNKEFECGTHFVLHFKSEERSVQETYNLLYKAIIELKSDTILFLRNIDEIKWEIPGKQGSYKKDKILKSCGKYKYYECEIKNGEKLVENYLLFEQALRKNDKLFVSIAYRVEEMAEYRKIIMEEKTTKLVVFFPMDGMETFLHFKVNGPYSTTNTRDNLSNEPKNKSDNSEILQETISLYEDSLRCIKELGLFDKNVLSKLPIDRKLQNNNEHSRAFYNSTLNLLKNEAFLPTTNQNEFARPDEALLVGKEELVELLSENEVSIIFNGRRKWLDSTIRPTGDNQDIYNYIQKTLSVRDIDTTVFINSVKDNLFAEKNDQWLLSFYKLANGIAAIKDNLDKKFIRLENGVMVAPFSGEEPNAFLPSKIKSSKTIKSIFTKDEEAVNFFTFIGIKQVDIVEEIREFVPIIRDSKNQKDYLDNLFIAFDAYKEATQNQKEKIAEIIRHSQCILCEDNEQGKNVFIEPDYTFIRGNNIQTLYEGLPHIYYVARIIEDKCEDYEFKQFLENIGVNMAIRLVMQTNKLSQEEREKIISIESLTWIKDEAPQVLYLEKILHNITEKKSIALWNALKDFYEFRYNGKLYYESTQPSSFKVFKSYFVRNLQKAKWLYNEQNELVSPNEIYYEDLLKRYPKNEEIKDFFDFKPTLINQLSKDIQDKLKIIEEVPIEILRATAEAYRREQEKNEEFNPVDITECDIPITEEAFTNSKSGIDENDLNNEEEQNRKENEENIGIGDIVTDILGDDNKQTENTYTVRKDTSKKRKEVGNWGEKLVFKQIKKQYEKNGYKIKDETEFSFFASKNEELLTVTHHNDDKKNQHGYDISVKRGEETLEYIEVKSSEKETDEFDVSGIQWEFSKTLAKRGEGQKYYLYFVTNAGTTKAKIKPLCNPYQKWFDGCIEADPIRVKI